MTGPNSLCPTHFPNPLKYRWFVPFDLVRSAVCLSLLFLKFEALISSTIEETKDIPEVISETGKIGMPHKGKHLHFFPS